MPSLTQTAPRKSRKAPVFKSRASALRARVGQLRSSLAYDETTYRRINAAIVGKRYASDMTEPELEGLITVLEGFDAERRLTRPRYDEPVSDPEALEILGMAA